MEPALIAHLLGAIEAGRLVIVCGAGLSMAPPSNLPSARRVAEVCFDAYQTQIDPQIDVALRTDMEAFAERFVENHKLKPVFIERLVPWPAFVRPSNAGHAAVADFLIVRAAFAALSSNYDCLVEQQATNYGFDFQNALDGDEANDQATKQGPLLKFHGCSKRDRSSTVWAASQLDDEVIARRIAKSQVWMAANLRRKDLLIIGFWSDWQYLNQIVTAALTDVGATSVTVIDPSTIDQLQEKAPGLWAIAHAEGVTFHHMQMSGAEALDELRSAFSQGYLRQVLAAGRETFVASTGAQVEPTWLQFDNLDSEELYAWRRDAEGVPSSCPALKQRPDNCEVLGYFHLLLRQAGAQPTVGGYQLAGETIRLVNGSGAVLSTLRARFVEAPISTTADLVVAVGAEDLGLPSNTVRQGRQGDIVRPEAVGDWLSMSSARTRLNI